MDRTENLQRGIAIAPILFVVAILAVLAMAIAAGSGAFNGDTSAVKAKAQATAILEYAEQVKMAVDRVRGHGCLDTEISFENPFVSGYTNPNAPSDKSCHVFDVNGGGIVWKTPPSSSQNQADHDAANPTYGGSKVPTGNFGMASICVMGVGTGGRCQAGNCGLSTFPCYYTDGRTSADVVMYLPWVARDVCLAINQISGFKNKVNGDPPGTGGGSGYTLYGTNHQFFVGIFYTANHGNGGIPTDTVYGNPPEILGALQGCFDNRFNTGPGPGGGYYFFKVLLAR